MAATDRTPLSFAAQLKRARRAARLTQEQLAEKAGYSVSYVSMLERGERVPVRATVEILADALDLDAAVRTAFEGAARDPRTPNEHATNPPIPLPQVPPPPVFPAPTGTGPLPIVGRGTELALLDHHLAGDGAPLLLFTGEPGIGKSRLLAEGRVRAEARGWSVLAGGSQRRGASMPYVPLLEALERHLTHQTPTQLKAALQGCGWLAPLLPELVDSRALPPPSWSLPPEQERRLVFSAVGRYLANVAGPAGTLLVLDDLQWTGPDAIDLLTAALRSSAGRLRILGAYRDADVAPGSPLANMLADLAPAALVTVRPLAPLDERSAAELAEDLLPPAERRDELVERVVRRTGGVPFYLVSYAQRLRSGATESGADSSAEDVPWDVTQTIRQRVAALPNAAGEVLAAAALAAPPVPGALLIAAVHGPARDEALASDALDASCRARLLIETGSGVYQFAHEVTREVIASDIGAARRASIHRRLAEALQRTPGEKPIEALAYHYLNGGEPERAAPYLAQAGVRASGMQAFAAAEGYYRELVDVLERLGQRAEAAEAREKLAAAQITQTHYLAAIETLGKAQMTYARLGDGAGEGRTVAQIALAYAASGDASPGIARTEPFLAAAETRGLPPEVLATLCDALGQLDNVAGRYAEQLSATTRAVTYARDSGVGRLLAQAQMRHGNALRMVGRLGEATAELEEAIRLAESEGDHANLSFALENISLVYLLQGYLDKASAYIRRALTLVEHLGDPIVISLMTLRRGMTDYVIGEWDAAQVDFERTDELLRGVGVSWVSAYAATGLGQIRLVRGDAAAGVRHLEEAVALAKRSGDLQALRWAQQALAERALLDGRPTEARERLIPLGDRHGQQELLVTYMLPYRAWAEAEIGDAAQAHADVEACLTRARAEHIHLALADGLRVRALLALRDGDPHSALATLEECLVLCHDMPHPYAEAKAYYVSGLAHRAAGNIAVARDSLEHARRICARLGEGLYAPHIASALADLG